MKSTTQVAAALSGLEQQIGRVTQAVSMSGGSASLLGKLADLEKQREELMRELDEAQHRAHQARAMRRITAKDLEAHWQFLSTTVAADIAWARTTLRSVVARIEFDPNAKTLRIDYHVALGKPAKRRAIVASPARFELAYLP